MLIANSGKNNDFVDRARGTIRVMAMAFNFGSQKQPHPCKISYKMLFLFTILYFAAATSLQSKQLIDIIVLPYAFFIIA
jgi:hypothetical protein